MHVKAIHDFDWSGVYRPNQRESRSGLLLRETSVLSVKRSALEFVFDADTHEVGPSGAHGSPHTRAMIQSIHVPDSRLFAFFKDLQRLGRDKPGKDPFKTLVIAVTGRIAVVVRR
jgi:hypothetical protein